MRKGKVLQGALVLAAAAAVSVGVSATDASAATITITGVSINTTEQTLTIAAKSDVEIGIGVATVKATKEKDADGNIKSVLTPAADAAWDWYDNTAAVTVDLSSLVNTKDNYIQIKGSSAAKSDPVTIKIPAVDTTVSGKFDGIGKVNITYKDGEVKTHDVSKTPFEYKTSYGAWTPYTTSTDLSKYQIKGASLTFRARAVTNSAVAVATVAAGKQTLNTKAAAANILADNKLGIYASATATAPENIYVSYPFSGKEFKVAIAKLANAPKVTINYLNDTLTIPKGAEYRVVGAALGVWKGAGEGTATTTDTAVNTAKAVTLRTERTLNDIGMVATTGVAGAATVEVRTAATETKAASKWSRVNFNALEMIRTNTTGKPSSSVANLKPIAASAIGNNWVGTASKVDGGDVTVTCVAAKNAGTYDLVFTNNTADKYQIVVENSDKTNTDAKGNVTYEYKYYKANTALNTSVFPPTDISVDIAAKKTEGMGTVVSVKSIPAGKTAKDADGNITVTAPSTFKLNAKEGAQIFIARTGDAKAGTWTTRYLPLGTVK